MNLRNRLKPELKISKIGTLRFWAGIVIGILYAIVISLFFNYSREILRFLTGVFSDLIILERKTSIFFNIFFAAFSSAIGFSITFWIWMSNPRNELRKHRLFKRLSQVNSTLIIWIPLMMIARIGSILFFILYSSHGYDSDLKLIENFQLLFILLPIIMFFYNWISIRKIFKTKNWILSSFIIYLVVSFLVYKFSSVDNQIVDNNYISRYKEDYRMIDYEIKRAKNKLNIVFLPSTIKTIKEWHTKSSIEQMEQVQKAFESKRNVSVDTIILQKIIVKNFKQGKWYSRKRNSFNNWPYVKPKEILKQIHLNKTNPTKLQELVRLLNEQVNLINYLDVERDSLNGLTQTERRKIFGSKFRIPEVVVTQLINVTNELKKIKEINNLTEKVNKISLLRER